MNDVAGEDSMLPNFEKFIRGKRLPDVIDVYVHNRFLDEAFASGYIPDRSTARRTIKFVRQYPIKRTIIGKVVDRLGSDRDSLNELSTGQLDLRRSKRLGSGNHSEVFSAPLKFPSTTPKSTIHGVVAVKLSNGGSDARMLEDEAKIYNAFPRNLHKADVPVVPNFYGYYVPHTEVFDQVNNDNDSSNSDEEEGKRGLLVKCIGPILLLEACGKPVRVRALSDSGRMAIGNLLNRLHKANFTQGSMYERNVLMQPGPINQPLANRSLSEPSYRIIDFGRGLGLGVDRTTQEDIKREVETEQRYARYERLIP